jgi:hypothetical protein
MAAEQKDIGRMTRSIHYNIKTVRGISPQALSATIAGKIIDRNGSESLEWPVSIGNVTATNATVVAKVFEGDATGAMATAAAGNVLGTLNLVGATSARVSGVSKFVEKKIGYIGSRRYSQLKLTPTVSAGIIVSAPAVLGDLHYMPSASE